MMGRIRRCGAAICPEMRLLLPWYAMLADLIRPNTGSGRYTLVTDAKCAYEVRFWYQVNLAKT
jgi:hypothetical protein